MKTSKYGIQINPILWTYITDSLLGETRFYQVTATNAIVEVNYDGKWIERKRFLDKYAHISSRLSDAEILKYYSDEIAA